MEWVMIGIKLTVGYVIVGIIFSLSILALFGCWWVWMMYLSDWCDERKRKRRQP